MTRVGDWDWLRGSQGSSRWSVEGDSDGGGGNITEGTEGKGISTNGLEVNVQVVGSSGHG